MVLLLVSVVLAMIVCHEAAHVLITVACGGRFEGVVLQHVLAVGVRIRVDDLSARQIALTLIAGPVAEALVLGVAWQIHPMAWPLWLLLLGTQWMLNLIPWPWFPNDGRKLWRLMRQGRSALTTVGR